VCALFNGRLVEQPKSSGPRIEVKHKVYMAEGTVLLAFVKLELKNESDHVARVLLELDCGSDVFIHKSMRLIKSSGIQTE
jgi:hypothetical protein